MREELIYRRDCDLFAESLDYEGMIHDTMTEYGFTWVNCKGEQDDPNHIFDFARTILQRAQNVINSAATAAYEYTIQSEDGLMYLLSYDEEVVHSAKITSEK
jgi:hypothetical protein